VLRLECCADGVDELFEVTRDTNVATASLRALISFVTPFIEF
jgi:hypothetical protein